jgi:hypothetical protein
MIEEMIENGGKIVRVAEEIQVGGTLATIMAIMLLIILCFILFWGSRGAKQSIVTMKEFGHATKEMAESIRTLVDENIKKDETSQRNIDDFNNVRRLHIEEIKRVTEMACSVDKTLEKVEEKQDSMALDVNKILTILEVK